MSNPKPVKKKIVVTEKQNKAKFSKAAASLKGEKPKVEMLFTKMNFYIFFVGIALIALGLLLMAGGKMPNYETWDESLIYSPRRIIISPIVILSGLGVIIYSIFRK